MHPYCLMKSVVFMCYIYLPTSHNFTPFLFLLELLLKCKNVSDFVLQSGVCRSTLFDTVLHCTRSALWPGIIVQTLVQVQLETAHTNYRVKKQYLLCFFWLWPHTNVVTPVCFSFIYHWIKSWNHHLQPQVCTHCLNVFVQQWEPIIHVGRNRQWT